MHATALKMDDFTIVATEDGTLVQIDNRPEITTLSIWEKALRPPYKSFEEMINDACKDVPITGNTTGKFDLQNDLGWFIPGCQNLTVEVFGDSGTEGPDMLAASLQTPGNTTTGNSGGLATTPPATYQ